MSQKPDIASFLERLEESRIVTGDSLAAAVTAAASTDTASTLAESLISSRTITRWQADRLLDGKKSGFFLGNYKLLAPLGKGSMGSVYLAEHTLMRRQCAIKVMVFVDDASQSFRTRFLREAQAVAALDHPNIVRAYDVASDELDGHTCHYLAMEFIDGENLQAYVDRVGPLPMAEAADLMAQTAAGIAHAHESGLVHRDIKPSNIFLDRSGRIKILDLGLAFTHNANEDEESSVTLEHDETILGTADYISPEQAINSHEVDTRTDIYSLGCTFYFVLTGKPPFHDGTVAMRLMAHQTKTARPLREVRPDVDPELANLVHAMLRKDRDRRPATANQIQSELLDWIERHADTVEDQAAGETIVGRHTELQSAPSSKPKWQKWLVGFALVAIATVLGIVLWPDPPPSDPAQEHAVVEDVSPATVLEAEHSARDAFFTKHFVDDGEPPFSFGFGASSFLDRHADWKKNVERVELDGKTRLVKTFADRNSQLVVVCDAIRYSDFPVVEWTVTLRNDGTEPSPLIQDLQGIDVDFPVTAADITANRRPRWNPATEEPADGQQPWSFEQGWVAGWEPMARVDRTTYPGLEMHRHGAGIPWVARNLSEKPVTVDECQVPPNTVAMMPNLGYKAASTQEGSAPAIVWDCQATNFYRIKLNIENIGRGGDGVEWLVHDWAWNILATGDVDDGSQESAELPRMLIGSGDRIALTINARDSTVGDLTLVDFTVEADGTPQPGDVLLRFAKGSVESRTDFEPVTLGLPPGTSSSFSPIGGRPTDGLVMPFFNIGSRAGGTILAVGWPGQWRTNFDRQTATQLRVTAGQASSRFRIAPGESARTPLMAVQFYEGDWLRGQNVWRRWVRTHNLPTDGDSPLKPTFSASSSRQFQHMSNAREENQKAFIDHYLDRGIPIDYWWMDTGWYPHPSDSDWDKTGTWHVDVERFPNGIRAVSEHAHRKKVKTLLWFEPERVTAGTEFDEQHPQWLLSQRDAPNSFLHQNDYRLFDLSNPRAVDWLSDFITKRLLDEKIDAYRQDFNVRPLYFWRAKDTEDGVGLTENLYVQGYLRFWDNLRERVPNLLIDSCASGGRRNDLESMRRSVPLWRSDEFATSIGQQCHTFGMALWYPYFGTSIAHPSRMSRYASRSRLCPHNSSQADVQSVNCDDVALRRIYREWQLVSEFQLADYYPLTDYSASADAWLAWQFHEPETGRGIIQAFRRGKSSEETYVVQLRGLVNRHDYVLTNIDTGASMTKTGADLRNRGVSLRIDSPPGASIWSYRTIE